jgi:nucleoside-diphosphate-sugar epimerase
MVMKVGITGSRGFVGKNLVSLLASKNLELFEFDRVLGNNISSPDFIGDDIKLDCIVHLAGDTFIPDSFNNPYTFYKNNINTTLCVLEYCRINNCKIVFASTYLYGQPVYLPIDENHSVIPHSPYTQSKKIAEDLILSYSRDFNVKSIILRLFNIYGDGQNESFLIPSIINQISKNKISLNDPEPKRDFIHVDDVCEAFYKAVIMDFDKSEIFNIGSGISYSVQEIIDILNRKLRIPIEVAYKYERRANEILNVVANNKKANIKLNWNPKIDLETGLINLLKDDVEGKN